MKKILVIEDNPFIRENIVVMLQFANYEVIDAENGISGIETVIAQKPDLVISDIMMPGLNGFEVLTALRNNPETATIPFIFLSAKSTNTSIIEGLELGADDYLVKPFHEQELLIAVENCLYGKPAFPKFI